MLFSAPEMLIKCDARDAINLKLQVNKFRQNNISPESPPQRSTALITD